MSGAGSAKQTPVTKKAFGVLVWVVEVGEQRVVCLIPANTYLRYSGIDGPGRYFPRYSVFDCCQSCINNRTILALMSNIGYIYI